MWLLDARRHAYARFIDASRPITRNASRDETPEGEEFGERLDKTLAAARRASSDLRIVGSEEAVLESAEVVGAIQAVWTPWFELVEALERRPDGSLAFPASADRAQLATQLRRAWHESLNDVETCLDQFQIVTAHEIQELASRPRGPNV
jgi:hypothetical protein